MKRLKSLWAALLAMMMVVAMGTTAYGADIIINEGVEDGSTYSAYRLMNAEENEQGGVLYSVNDTYEDVFVEIIQSAENDTVVSYIAECDETTEIQAFADTVYASVKTAGITPEYTTTTGVFQGVEQGYYLIVETTVGDNDSYSAAMLDTAGKNNVSITTKDGVPTLEKKVLEKNDTTGTTSDWQDGADYDLGDRVSFKLTGTLPSNYAKYKGYYYVFKDKLAEGLTFDSSSVVVKVDGSEVNPAKYEVATTGLQDEGYTFEVRFGNLKDVTTNADSKVTVEYNALLNEKAAIGMAGNPNIAKLLFSNDPYSNGTASDSTSETPEDKVIVFTYQLLVNKVNGTGNPLKGAGFTLYKSVEGEYKVVGNEVKGEDITTFTFTGLDAGIYKLVESTVPTGYNKAEDLIFEISAEYDTESDNPVLSGVAAKDENGAAISAGTEASFRVSDGVLSVDIENLSGFLLPTTGGIGTAIFYIVGAALMITAVVLLVVKRRKSN